MTKFSLLNNIIEFLPVANVYRTLLPVGIALGVGIGFVGSFFTIRKHLKGIIIVEVSYDTREKNNQSSAGIGIVFWIYLSGAGI